MVGAGLEDWLGLAAGAELEGALLEDADGLELELDGLELEGVVLARGSTYC